MREHGEEQAAAEAAAKREEEKAREAERAEREGKLARRQLAISELSKLDEPPARFKEPKNFTVEENLRFLQTGERPESDEYRAHRSRALRAAGLAEEPRHEKPVSEWSVADHFAEIQKQRR